MIHLPELPDPEKVFSVTNKASTVIDKGLDFINKVSLSLDQFGVSDEIAS